MLFCCLLGGIVAFSQTVPLSAADLRTINVDNISDEDIAAYYQKAQANGVTLEQALTLASQRGMPESEISKLRDRIANIGTIRSSAGNTVKSSSTKTEPRQTDTDASKVPMKPASGNFRIFGSELFAATSGVFEPNLRIATPAGYVLGPDDELIVNVYGYSEQTYKLTVNAEGNIYIPNVGPVFVNGLTIEEAATRIKNKLASTIYRAIGSGATKVSVSLGNIRSMRVTVIGAAKQPSTYTVSSLTTLFNLLYISGGPSDLGSYRYIEVVRGNKTIRVADLYRWLTTGDRSDDVLLQEQDVVRIPYYKTRVTLNGQVKRPGIFELKPGETFMQLVSYAGGFTDSAYKASVQVVQVTDREKKMANIVPQNFETYQPQSSDEITVSKILDRFTNRVSIIGAVFMPGNYELQPDMYLDQLIRNAGGVKEDAFVERGVIARIDEKMQPVSLSFNIKDVLEGRQKIKLSREDRVTIASIFDLQDRSVVTIEGQVRKPGAFEWRKNLKLNDLLLMAGGFTEFGNAKNIEVSRRIKDADVTSKSFKQAEIFTIYNSDDLAKSPSDFDLQPYDLVVVRSLPGYQQQRIIGLQGEVMNPGRYTLEKSNERVSDLINRAGGFKSSADSTVLKIKRYTTYHQGQNQEERKKQLERILNIDADSLSNNVKLRNELDREYETLSIDLTKAIQNPGSDDDLLLEDGDILIVERTFSLVKVSGEVYNPTLVTYARGRTLKYYMDQAGGPTTNARDSKAFVLYPDGKAATVKRFLFFKSYPEIRPHSEVFVPSKEARKGGLSIGELGVIASVLATIATIIIQIAKP